MLRRHAGPGRLGGWPYQQQLVSSLPMSQPTVPDLTALTAQFEATAIANAGGIVTPAIIMQVPSLSPLPSNNCDSFLTSLVKPFMQ
jgi:hypothetical protein